LRVGILVRSRARPRDRPSCAAGGGGRNGIVPRYRRVVAATALRQRSRFPWTRVAASALSALLSALAFFGSLEIIVIANLRDRDAPINTELLLDAGGRSAFLGWWQWSVPSETERRWR
jgi:hypothetical protein